MGLRIIGDVHGKTDRYLEIAKGAEYSLQLGDMSISNYDHLDGLDPDKSVFFKGNHDNYNVSDLHDLGDYGFRTIGGVAFFFVRGAFSVDMPSRIYDKYQNGKTSWWEREQLNFSEMLDCYEQYCDIKPELVITHTFPTSISNKMFGTIALKKFGFSPKTFFCHTASLLDRMLQSHKPERYIAGHFHESKVLETKHTHFRCLAELEYIDLEN